MSCYISHGNPFLWNFSLHMCSFIFSKRIKELPVHISGVFFLPLCYSALQISAAPVSLDYDLCLNKSTALCMAFPFLCHGLDCVSRWKVGTIFTSFICDPFSQGSQFCATCSTVSKDNIVEGQVWSHLFLHLIYIKN